MEWGATATIGFNAGGEAFQNNDYTSNAIACSSLPDSNVTNVVYRLSSANPEYPPPRKSSNHILTQSSMTLLSSAIENVQFSDITLTTATVSWVVPYTPTWQQYSVVYGVQADTLNQSWGLLYSPTDLTLTDQEYSITIQGLTQGTEYYVRVSSTFEYNLIYSELTSFLALDPRMCTVLSFCMTIIFFL